MGIDWCWLLPGLLLGWLSHALYTWWTIRQRYVELRSGVQAVESERNRFRADLDVARSNLEGRVKAHGLLEQELLGLRPQVAKLETIEADRAALQARVNDLEASSARVPGLERDLGDARTRLVDLEAQLTARKAEVTTLSARVAELEPVQAKLGTLEAELQEVHRGQQTVLADLRKQLSEAEHARARLDESLRISVTEIGNLRGKLGESDAARGKLPELEALVGSLQARVVEYQGVAAQLQSRDAERSALEARLRTLESDLSASNARLGPLEVERDRYRADVEARDRELTALRLKFTESEQRTGRLAELEKSVSDADFRIALAQGEQEKAQAALIARDAEIASLKAKLGGLEKTVADAQSNSKAVQDERDQFQTALKARDRDLEMLRLRVAELENTVSEAQTHATASGNLENTVSDLEARLNAAHAERDRVRADLTARDAERSSLRTRLDDLEKTDTDAQARIKAAQDERDQARAELSGQRTQLADLKQSSNRMAELESELNGLRARLNTAESSVTRLSAFEPQVASLTSQLSAITPYRERAVKLESDLIGAQSEVARLKAELEEARRVPDDLTKIDGIGAVFAKRLTAAGITRFDQLAQTPAERLQEIIKPEDWQKIEFDHWREDAATLARGGTPAKRTRTHERLARIAGIGDVFEKRLYNAGIHTFAQLAETTPERLLEISGSESRAEVELWVIEAAAYAQGKRPTREREKAVRGKLSEAEEELERLRTELRRAESLRRDPFAVMTQIGEAKQRKLYGAGIYLFKDLAQTSEPRLREIFDDEALDYPLLIREAAEYARGEVIVVRGRRADRFERLTGVSEEDSRTLYEAGVFTFAELAALPNARLTQIIGRAEVDGWQVEAGLFATGKAQIEYVDAGKRQRDQLWRVSGIGEVFEVRLNKAGIFSFEELAASSPDGLRQIIKPESWERIEPEMWIAQARELAAREVKE